MKKISAAICLIIFGVSTLFALDAPGPKREFRSVWLSTVANIDWPTSKYDSDTKKQQDLKNYLVKLKDSGCNSVLFQVRCACDAMYNSPYEPWSYWFNGDQGSEPTIDWDPLEYAVVEAHKLGMELHAWVNPYRSVKTPSQFNNSDYISDQHVSKQHPEWILKFSDVYILDPGQQEVRDYITMVLMDIVNRYDIDGIHMDDYFYPYSGISNEDNATFSAENRGFTDRKDWRRDNINLLVKSMMDSINAVKPWIKWGISPFGIYKPNVPQGVSSMDAYNVLYCDPLAWLRDGSVDYLTPQCYWAFDTNQDYGTLIPWWAAKCKTYGKHFYPGQAMYRAAVFPYGEMSRQVRLNRATNNCDGNVFFTANNFYDNFKGSVDSLKNNLYRYQAIWPVMPWKDETVPEKPVNCQVDILAEGSSLSWEAPAYSDPGDSAYGYVVYRSPYPFLDLEDVTKMISVNLDQESTYEDNITGSWFYAISTLDRYKNESEAAILQMPFVTPVFPEYATEIAPIECDFQWESFAGSASYQFQLAREADFSDLLVDETVTDTVYSSSLEYETNYFWRVKSDAGSYWSPVWTFRSQLPPQVAQLFPKASQGGLGRDIQFRWESLEDASDYELRIYSEDDMESVMLSTHLSATSYDLSGLDYGKRYYWQIRSDKYDRWSDLSRFRTKDEFMNTLWTRAQIDGQNPVWENEEVLEKGLAYGVQNGQEYLYISQIHSGSVSIRKVNASEGSDTRIAVSTEGITSLADLEMSADGYLFASVPAQVGETFKIYMWTNDAGAPVLVYDLDNIAYDLGEYITVRGSVSDGSVECYAAGADSDKMLKMTWDVVNQEFIAQQITLDRENNPRPCVAFIPGSDDLYVNSEDYYLRHFTSDGTNVDWMLRNYTIPQSAHSTVGFAYGEKSYIAAYGSDHESAYVVDIYNGVRTALSAAETPDLGTVENPDMLGDIEVKDNGDGTVTIFVLGSGNGFAAYSYDMANASVSVDASSAAADLFTLSGSYPNPFNPESVISYSLNRAAEVSLQIYDLRGNLMQEMDTQYQSAGVYSYKVNGAAWPSGTYLYRLKVNGQARAGKMTLLK